MAGALPANFGQKYLKTGQFGQKGKQAIKTAGFATPQDFLKAANVNMNSANLAGNQQGFKPVFQQTLAAGNNPSGTPTSNGGTINNPNGAPTQDPVQPQNPTPPAQPGLGQGFMQQAVDQTNAGANILNNGNPATDPLLGAGGNYTTGAQQDFGKVDMLAGSARAKGADILNTLSQQQVAADQDIQNLFNAQPLDTLRSNLAQMNSAAQAGGRTNSRSGNEMSADLQRGLLRDQATARLGSNNQFRAQTIGELGTQRQTDLGLGNMYSGQGLGQGQLGNQALSTGGQLVNDTNRVGNEIFNNGFQNQLGTVGLINNLSQQNFNTQNQLLQKALANITGSRQNRQSMDILRQQLAMQQQAAQGPSFMEGLLSSGLGAATGGLF